MNHKAKITDFNNSCSIDKNVAWLEVSVYQSLGMNVCNTVDQLSEYEICVKTGNFELTCLNQRRKRKPLAEFHLYVQKYGFC